MQLWKADAVCTRFCCLLSGVQDYKPDKIGTLQDKVLSICIYNYLKLYNIISNQSATDKKQNENFNIWLVLHYLSDCGHLYQSQGENATESRKRALFATISKRTQFAQSRSNAQSAKNDLLRFYKTTTTQHPTRHTQDRRKESQRAGTGAGSGNG